MSQQHTQRPYAARWTPATTANIIRTTAVPASPMLKRRAPTVTPGAASIENPSITDGSRCPFANTISSSSRRSNFGSSELAKLHGPGWSVLPDGNSTQLPHAEAKPTWSPLHFLLGDIEELRKGEAPFMLERFKRYGPVFKWRLGRDDMTAVLEHDTVKSLLVHGDGKVVSFWTPPASEAFQSKEGRKLMESPSGRMSQRKTLAPGFSRQALRQVMSKIESICGRKLKEWSTADRDVDLAKEGRELAFDFSTQLLVNFNVPDEQRNNVKAKLDMMFKAMFYPPINIPGTMFYKGVKAKQELMEEIKAILRSGATNEEDHSAFDLIVQAIRENKGAEPSVEDMAESGIGLLLAGTDTSGGGSTAAMAMLACFPEVMQKLREEQQQVMAEMGPALTLKALDAMPYAEAVIKEALRLAPPAGAVMRRTLVDLEIKGKYVPAGSYLYLSTFIPMNLNDHQLHPETHGMDDLSPTDITSLMSTWKKVNYDLLQREFRPERWLKQQTDAHKSSGLLAFSVGPHTCLGMTLFMAEAKVLLAMLAREYELQPEHPESLAFNMMMSAQLNSNAGARVRFVRRQTVGAASVNNRQLAGTAA